MNKITKFARILFLVFFVSSCGNYKKVAYMQEDLSQTTLQEPIVYDARIMPNDLLTITVNAIDKEAGMPFNLLYPSAGVTSGAYGAQSLQKYLVDNQGYINFPTVGMLYVGGKTRREAEALILEKIAANFKEEPIVIVSFSDYKISVVGEVARPGTFTIANEKVNILQALSLAGDMTIYGKRENVKIFREQANGEKEVIELNLNDRAVLYSPNFYLQQNDVLYVEPNKAKAQGSEVGSVTPLLFSSVSILVSVTNLIFNITRYTNSSK